MALIAPNDGEQFLLGLMLGNKTQQDFKLRLFVQPTVAPTENTVFADITEPSGGGYAAISMPKAGWSVATDGSGVTSAGYAQQTFSFSAAANVYGYLVTADDGATTRILWIERFSGAPFTLPAGGGAIAITPKIILD